MIERTANVRYWHKADIPSCTAHVRFLGSNVRQYATGLDALGLIGWRRKMKTQAAAA